MRGEDVKVGREKDGRLSGSFDTPGCRGARIVTT